jgi:hypothetical protein
MHNNLVVNRICCHAALCLIAVGENGMVRLEALVALYTSFVGAPFMQSCDFRVYGQAIVFSYSNQFSANVQGKSFVVQRSQSSPREDESLRGLCVKTLKMLVMRADSLEVHV